jgi:HEAT repeat protein
MKRWTVVALVLALTLLLAVTAAEASEFTDLLDKHAAEKDYKVRQKLEEKMRAIIKPSDAKEIAKRLTEPSTMTAYALVSLLERNCGEDGARELRKLLAPDPNWFGNYVATALFRLKDPNVVKTVIGWSRDTSLPQNTRDYFVNTMRSMRDPLCLSRLKEIVASEASEATRRNALKALHYQPWKEGELVPYMKKIADDKEHPLAKDAMEILVSRGVEGYGADMLNELAAGTLDQTKANSVIQSIQKSPTPDKLEKLREALKNNDNSYILSRILNTLGYLHDDDSREAIEALLESEDETVALAALDAVSRLGGDNKSLFSRLLNHENPKFRLRGAKGLLGRDDFSVLPALSELSKADDAQTRRDALSALGTAKIRESVPPLIHGLNDKDQTVRQAAHSALNGILRGLFPYMDFDWKAVGYSYVNTGQVAPSGQTPCTPEEREKAVKKIQDWWDSVKDEEKD